MNEIALIFPGQGSQYTGMGKELYHSSTLARDVFDQAQELLRLDIKRLCFDGPEEELKQTKVCQPAILSLSIALLGEFFNHPKSKNLAIKFAAGLSLGEYSALVAAGAISFDDAVMLVKQRADFMEEEARAHPGKMLAVIGMDKEKVLKIAQDSGVEVANLNAPGQIVLSGPTVNIEAAKEQANKAGAKAAVVLEVGGAFHSSLMQGAAAKFSTTLQAIKLSPPEFPVISNVTAQPETDPEEIRQNLARQITSSVLWEESVRYIASQGIKTFLEIGPGKVLKGILRRIDPDLTVYNIENTADIDNLPL